LEREHRDDGQTQSRRDEDERAVVSENNPFAKTIMVCEEPFRFSNSCHSLGEAVTAAIPCLWVLRRGFTVKKSSIKILSLVSAGLAFQAAIVHCQRSAGLEDWPIGTTSAGYYIAVLATTIGLPLAFWSICPQKGFRLPVNHVLGLACSCLLIYYLNGALMPTLEWLFHHAPYWLLLLHPHAKGDSILVLGAGAAISTVARYLETLYCPTENVLTFGVWDNAHNLYHFSELLIIEGGWRLLTSSSKSEGIKKQK
jgi:hypothetical protein